LRPVDLLVYAVDRFLIQLYITIAGPAFLEVLDITLWELQLSEVLQTRRIADALRYLKSISMFQVLDVLHRPDVCAHWCIDPHCSCNGNFVFGVRVEGFRY